MKNLRDQNYFEHYSKNDIHEIMCSDKVRVSAYADALSIAAGGKSIIDIGSGTGTLCFAAVDGGADRVYGIE